MRRYGRCNAAAGTKTSDDEAARFMMRSEVQEKVRHGLVSLWDVADRRQVGIGHVEYSRDPGVVCRHRWVLTHGYTYAPTGIRYCPVNGAVAAEEAEKVLSAQWAPDARLIVCEARTLDINSPSPYETRHEAEPHTANRRHERIELRGVWPICVDKVTVGFILVPDVQTFEKAPSPVDRAGPAHGSLPTKGARLDVQNRYVEHWILLDQPFPLLRKEVVVAASLGQWKPEERSFFEEVRAKVTPDGSYTEVQCTTYVEAV